MSDPTVEGKERINIFSYKKKEHLWQHTEKGQTCIVLKKAKID